MLAANPDGMTLSEISMELGLPKTSVFDIAQTLRQEHFLREVKKRFAIGYMAREIGDAYEADKDLYGIAKQHLTALADELNMAASLVLYENDGLDYVVEYRPVGSIVAPGASSGHSYIHASASGKVLLAFMQGARRQKALATLEFIPFTERTIVTAEAFAAELDTVKKRGYALDDREFNTLMTCISAPLFNRNQAIAAITLSGLQIAPESIPVIAGRIIMTSRAISELLTAGRDRD